MENTYLVNSEDLTSVADAIRTKGETGEPIVFPDGFVTAIENIKGGAELNFEVVGGTTQPSNPKENTIWVNTSTEITGWAFSTEEPSSPAAGMVWISVSTTSVAPFNALKENSVQVYPIKVKQRVSSKWTEKDGYIYYNGKWVYIDRPITYLYKSGNQYSDLTGGWTATGYSAGLTVSKGTLSTNKMTLNGAEGKITLLGTDEPIHICDASTITFVGALTSVYDDVYGLMFSVSTTKDTDDEVAYGDVVDVGDFEVKVDISALKGNYHIVCMAHGSTESKGYITEVYIQ